MCLNLLNGTVRNKARMLYGVGWVIEESNGTLRMLSTAVRSTLTCWGSSRGLLWLLWLHGAKA